MTLMEAVLNLRERVVKLEALAGIRTGSLVKCPQDSYVRLTVVELAVLQAGKNGTDNTVIAEQLGLSRSRVRNCASDAYKKLKITNRTEAALLLVHDSVLSDLAVRAYAEYSTRKGIGGTNVPGSKAGTLAR